MKKVEKNSLNWIISIHKSVLLSYLLYSSFRLKGLKPINQHWTIHGGHRRCALKMQQYSDTLHLLADINKNWKKEARNTCMLLLPSLFKTCQKPTSSSSMRINTLRVVCKMLSYEQIIDNVWWHFTRTDTDNVHHKHWSLLYIWKVWVLQLPSSPSRRSKTGSQNWCKKLIQNWITKYFHDNRFEKPALLLIPFLKRYTFIKHQVWSHV